VNFVRSLLAAPLLALAACATTAGQRLAAPAEPVEVQVLAINDFHGNLEPPKIAIETTGPDGATVKVPAGGVALLAAAAKALRAGSDYSLTVSAGDMIGGSPLVSALFLDEPTIGAMELVGVDYNAVGNHEFDKGSAELLRMQRGGCQQHTTKRPCRLEPFDGAAFTFLAANVRTDDGSTLFPGTAVRDFGPVQVGIIGMTLKETATLVTPAGVAGLSFADEAETANAAVPALRAAGADAILLLIHQGARTSGGYNDKACPDLSGDVLPIIAALDPAIDVVISGHTHAAYICELPRAGSKRPLLLTSAGRYGTLISDIRLAFGADGALIGHRADNVVVQGEGYTAGTIAVGQVESVPRFAADPDTKALVERYVAAAEPEAQRVVGKLSGPVTRQPNEHGEHSAGALIADAQLEASRSQGAQIAFINSGGVRTDLVPAADGSVTYGQIFAMQPFGNSLVVKTLPGAQLKALLEQQFASGSNSAEQPEMLLPSSGFFFAFDLSLPEGSRIVDMQLYGEPVDPAASYRVAVNNFLASGGDNFTVLIEGSQATDAGLDLDALEAFLRSKAVLPKPGRIENRTP
jgi:5'-nucleotidase